MTSPRKVNRLPLIGDPAPVFVLGAYPPGIVRLASYRDKQSVVLAFYPGDNLPGCTIQLQAFSRDLEKFHQAGAVVFAVSRDTRESHKEFARQYDIRVPLLNDIRGTVCQAYGVMERDQLRPERVTFVINRQGCVHHIVRYMPEVDTLLAIVQSLRLS
jgi:peroxiredoxin Q/BCP